MELDSDTSLCNGVNAAVEAASRKTGCSKLAQMFYSFVVVPQDTVRSPTALTRTLAYLSERLPNRHLTVLIVDDNIGFICWLGQLLAKAGYQSVPATDCGQAVARLEKLRRNVHAAIVNRTLSKPNTSLSTSPIKTKTQARLWRAWATQKFRNCKHPPLQVNFENAVRESRHSSS